MSAISARFHDAIAHVDFSANTGLTGLTSKYSTACTIVAPFILDTGLHVSISTTDIVYWTRFKHLHSWGMTGWGTRRFTHEAFADH